MRSARGLCLCLLFPGRILRGLGGLLGGCDGWIRRDINFEIRVKMLTLSLWAVGEI